MPGHGQAMPRPPAPTRRRALRDTTGAAALDESRARVLLAALAAGVPPPEQRGVRDAGSGRLPAPGLGAGDAGPVPGSLPSVPGCLGGELGAGGDVKLGEHVREMRLHCPA